MKFFATLLTALVIITNVGCQKECEEIKPTPIPTPPPTPTPSIPVVENIEDSIKNGLWAYYDFNSNSFSDKSGHNRNIDGYNNIRFGYDAWGLESNALVFDGVNDYAVIDSGRYFPEGDFTISFMMKANQSYGRIFQKANFNDARGASFGIGFDEAQFTNRFVFNISKDNNVCSNYTDINNSTPLFISKVFYPDAWYFVTVMHQKGIEKVYINNVLVGSQQTPNLSFKNCTTAPFYLGMWWLQDTHHFNGKVDELRIHTRALTEKEISYLYGKLK